MQVKTTMRYQYAPVLEWPKSRTLTIPNAGEDVEQQELSLLVGMKNGTITLENSLVFICLFTN